MTQRTCFAVFATLLSIGCTGDETTADSDADVDADSDTDADADSDTDANEPSPLVGVLFINEIFVGADGPPDGDGNPTTPDAIIEIRNASNADVTLGVANLCTKPVYWTVGETVVVPANGFLSVHYADGTNTATDAFGAGRGEGDFEWIDWLFVDANELALYDTNNAFDLPGSHSHIVDYVKWGTGRDEVVNCTPGAECSRETEAVDAGLWTLGATIDPTGWDETNSLSRTGPGRDPTAWAAAASTIGAAN